jgi:hypothetical protein
MLTQVFWNVVLYCLKIATRHSNEPSVFEFRVRRFRKSALLFPKDGCITLFRNFGIYHWIRRSILEQFALRSLEKVDSLQSYLLVRCCLRYA